jgi:two-component system response regulator AtoC
MSCTATPAHASVAPDVGLPPDEVVFGTSPAMRVIRMKAERAANTNVPVLLQGESGTGKEVIARFIHYSSRWNTGPFVKVNCPAIPGTLLESELFGYEKGAFTGAYGTKPGRVELAHRGTLFLDEIAELDPTIQAKLLQLLQDGQFWRIGAQGGKQVEVRVVCATNRHLSQEIKSGTFRPDLFYRINVVGIHLPLLRERETDIPTLIEYFLDRFSKQYKLQVRPPSTELLGLLRQHPWPGNIRELENLIRNYVIMGSEQAIRSELLNGREEAGNCDLPPNGTACLKSLTREVVIDFERRIISKALEAHLWNRKQTALALKISYRSLLYKISQTGISRKRTAPTEWRDRAASDD